MGVHKQFISAFVATSAAFHSYRRFQRKKHEYKFGHTTTCVCTYMLIVHIFGQPKNAFAYHTPNKLANLAFVLLAEKGAGSKAEK